MPAPDFALRAVAGPNVRLSEHIGQVVVISFWGAGCDGCRAQLAALERDFSRYRAQGLRVYGVEVATTSRRRCVSRAGRRSHFHCCSIRPRRSRGSMTSTTCR